MRLCLAQGGHCDPVPDRVCTRQAPRHLPLRVKGRGASHNLLGVQRLAGARSWHRSVLALSPHKLTLPLLPVGE